MEKGTISLVITTYNGIQFLGEQLDSIASQTRLPDEILILDDCSTDNTRMFLQMFMEDHPELPIRLIFNSQNVGWRKNFINGIDQTTCEYVILCDQDDIWYSNKIAELEQVITSNNQYKMIASNYDLLNMRSNGGQEKKQTSSMENSGDVVFQKITTDFYNVNRPGCTYIFKRSMFEECKDLWFEGLAHDKLLWTYSILDKSLGIYQKSLMLFRRHENNATGITSLSGSKDGRTIAAERNYKIICDIYSKKIDVLSPEEIIIIEKYLAYEKNRMYLLNHPSIFKWFVHAIRYRAYTYSIKSVLKDMYISIAKA